MNKGYQTIEINTEEYRFGEELALPPETFAIMRYARKHLVIDFNCKKFYADITPVELNLTAVLNRTVIIGSDETSIVYCVILPFNAQINAALFIIVGDTSCSLMIMPQPVNGG